MDQILGKVVDHLSPVTTSHFSFLSITINRFIAYCDLIECIFVGVGSKLDSDDQQDEQNNSKDNTADCGEINTLGSQLL